MIKGLSLICSRSSRLANFENARFMGTSGLSRTEQRKRRNDLFEKEKHRQREAVGRINKIKVQYSTWNEDLTLLMNQNISTPYDCARHITEGTAKLSALAMVNGKPWDMHRPLEDECELKLATMRTPGDRSVNNAFWRTCSLVLGSVVESAFKDDIEVILHSFIGPNIKSGSFIYDAYMGLENWEPTLAELRSISALFVKVTGASLPVERLEVQTDLALKMFESNPYKSKQIPDIASHNDDKIILYRIGDYVDISKGPVIGHTGLIGRSTVAAVHRIQNENGEALYRFQGVAIPAGILLNHFTYGILEERAKKLNESIWMPQRVADETEENIAMAVKN
ncbi:39S ribosomal protein L39, mitochondrial [Venturia canescens]|uniref:39S ribosomal protein L39, mitochondrial n=1 Tax=Venturia canescens TaxID=32260 RepID=UPI001C9D39BB|nr:39S ribosomal protein L39, mitochondrial [Venturia canescens]